MAAEKSFLLKFISDLGSTEADAKRAADVVEQSAARINKANESVAASTAATGKAQVDAAGTFTGSTRKFTDAEKEAYRLSLGLDKLSNQLRSEKALAEYGQTVTATGTRFAQFASILAPLGITAGGVGREFSRLGRGIAGVAKDSGESAPLFTTLAQGAVILAAGVIALTLAYKGFKGLVEASASEDGIETKFALLEGNLTKARDRIAEIKQQASDNGTIGFKTEDILKAAEAMERLSGGALKGGDSLKMLAGIATGSSHSIEWFGEQVGRLFNELRDGTKAAPTLKALTEVGVISLSTRKKIDDLLEAGKKGPAVWALAAADLQRFADNNKIAGDTFTGNLTNLGNAWEELKKTLGQPIKDWLTPWLKDVTWVIEKLTDAVKVSLPYVQAYFRVLLGILSSGLTELGTATVSTDPKVRSFGQDGSKQMAVAPEPSRPPPKDPKDKGGKSQSEMEATRRLTEEIRVAQQQYNQEVEKTQLLVDSGAISVQTGYERDASYAQMYIGKLKDIYDRLEQQIGIEERAGNTRGAQKLREEFARVEVQILKTNQALSNTTPIGRLTNDVRKLANEWGDVGKQISKFSVDVANQLTDGVGQALSGLIFQTKSFGQVFMQIGQSIVQNLITIGVRMMANWLIQKLIDAATPVSAAVAAGKVVATQVAAGAAIAVAHAPAAAAVSISSYGLAAVLAAALVGIAVGAIIGMLASGGGKAAGGLVDGAPSTRDNVLLPMATGEYVINSRATSHYGPRLFDALNSMRMPRVSSPRAGAAVGRGGAGGSAGGGGGGDMRVIMVHDMRTAIKMQTDHPDWKGAVIKTVTPHLQSLGVSR